MEDMTQKLFHVGEAFNLKGLFFSYEDICMGNVNHTYKVNYIRDDGGRAVTKSYLFQRVNTYAFRNPVELMENIDNVTGHIREHHPENVSLHYHHTGEGSDRRTYLFDGDEFWRVCNYVPSVTFMTCDNLQVIHDAGEAFGDFQNMLSDFDASRLYYTIPDFHDTRKRYAALKESVAADPCGRVKEVRPELDYLLSIEDQACRLTDMYNAGQLPLRVTHNDTKINNVLFDEKTHKPLVVIDLDTVMPGLMGHDFGDAVRFAANFTEEDSRDISRTGLDLNIFWSFAEGFISKTAASMTDAEADSLGNSCFALACELSTRFLNDYIQGDPYFKINYPDHNLVRTRCQIRLAQDMEVKKGAMDSIIGGCVEKYRQAGK